MIEIDSYSFAKIADIARQEAGLHLSSSKAGMVHARLQKRLRKLGMRDYKTYCELLSADSPKGVSERRSLIEALTTNVTHFFREAHHFPILAEHFRRHKALATDRPFRIWSAGCSNGSEPVSICLQIAALPQCTSAEEFSIFASDIDGGALAFAQAGVYPDSALNPESRTPYERFLTSSKSGSFSLASPWRDRIEFMRASLLEPPPKSGLFDVIFCRNVTIYFDSDTAAGVHSQFISVLREGGLLCLGHSERLVKPVFVSQCERVGPTAYEKKSQGN